MKTDVFDYDLDPKYIAQSPAEPRDSSRLLVLHKDTGKIEHKIFRDIIDFLNTNDCLVVNETKVLPARLFGCKKSTGAKIELLLVQESSENVWKGLAKPAKRLSAGDEIDLGSFSVQVIGKDEDGEIEITSETLIREAIQKEGHLPLPPYIKDYRGPEERYQTVYASKSGSVAAPTAGLHFTSRLFDEVLSSGIRLAKVDLTVGWDTFRPVRERNIQDHKIHSERFSLSEEAAKIINTTKEKGGRVIAVGTTSVRVLESCAKDGKVVAQDGPTSLFIYPGYEFKITDTMITNFHLPRSTLLMLVSAFAGQKKILEAYEEAKKKDYRFFSFGDAMLIL